jgi:hypothetical protein
MTEEFDAMFGITEPEDIPDQVIKSQEFKTITKSASGGPQESSDEVESDSCEDWDSDRYYDEDEYGRSRSYYDDDDSDDESGGCVIS